MDFDPLNPFLQAGRSFSDLIDQSKGPCVSQFHFTSIDPSPAFASLSLLAGSHLPPSEPLHFGSDVGGPLASLLTPPTASAFDMASVFPSEPLTFGPSVSGPLASLLAPPPAPAFDSTSLMTKGPLSFVEIYETAVKSFPRPIDFLNPFSQLLSNPADPAPWLTPTIGFAQPNKGLADLLEASYLTQLTNDLVSPSVKSVAPASSPAFQTLLKDFHSTSQSYTNLICAAEIGSLDPALFAIPARGYFASGDTLLQLHRAWPVSAPLQHTRESTRDGIYRRREGKLEVLLSKLDPDLCELWWGAHLAAASSNPDRTRHACVSVRELITQVMQALAPTAKVLTWTSDPARFHNGKPTRQTRLLYICQSVAGGALSNYIDAKIKSVVALADVLQKGTHGIGVEFSSLELQLIFNGIEEVLCSLIEVGDASE